ncbi:MAG: VOC family protein [Iphinoe sp. HA4291-MV1]|jgi:catechol 2,3-dioxygenase-like lactoylglutathione lyase family enzyme|nr:VOC family protein [Iphinoe sp. HA4291-MV1]
MITGINHINLSVKNLEESFQFYKEVLGFTYQYNSGKIDGNLAHPALRRVGNFAEFFKKAWKTRLLRS